MARMGETKFSVIIPAFNVAPYIEECIQSALGQTCMDLEVIVIDDGSTDGTAGVVESFDDGRVRLIRNPSNRGVSYSRNAGISEARGEYLVLLDSDDILAPNRLDTFSKYLEHEQTDLIFDDLLYFRDGEPATGVTAFSMRGIAAHDVGHLGYAAFVSKDLAILKGVIRKAFLTEHSIAYAEGHSVGEDFALYSEIFLSGAKVSFIPDALYLYRQRESSLATTVSAKYYASLIETTGLVLSRHDQSPHKPLLNARLRHQKTALGQYETIAKLKSRDFMGALSHLMKDPRIGMGIATSTSRSWSFAARLDPS